MTGKAQKERGEPLARLDVAVELYAGEGSVFIVKHRRTAKRRPGPPVELMNQLEAYARKVYAHELRALTKKPRTKPA